VPTSAGNTYFSNRIANTSLIDNADAYWSPEELLTLTTAANLFPYQTMIDESGPDGSRDVQSNGGNPTGNFGTDGWTRSEFGAGNADWTGFGVLHQGQASTRTLQLDRATLEAGNTFTLDVAVVAKYNDPRGGLSGVEKRGNRLPPASPDAQKFAYRMPHGALDVERLTLQSTDGDFVPNTISSQTLRFQVIDWDARGIETGAAELAEDMDVTTVAVGESGVPSLAVCIPGVLGDATVIDTWDAATLIDDDTAYGGDAGQDAGHPGDALFFEKLITKNAGSGQSDGDYTGMVRATDVETAIAGGLTIALDGDLAPVTGQVPIPETYQPFAVPMFLLNGPPTGTATVTTPQITPGSGVTISLTNLADPEDLTVTALIDWDDDGTVDFTSLPIPVPDAGPININSSTSGGMTFTFTPPAPDYRNLQISITDGFYTVDITPAPGLSGQHYEVLQIIPGWVRTYGSTTGTTRFWDVVVDGAGNAYCAGKYTGGSDFGTGPVSAVGGDDLIVLKLDQFGTRVWHTVFGSTGTDEIQAIGIDPAGNTYITGSYGGTINFTGTPRSFAGGIVDAFLVKLDPSGTAIWDKTYNSGGDDRGWGVDVNDAGTEVAFTGSLGGAHNFGGGLRQAQRRFAVKYDSAGTYLWDPVWTAVPGSNIYGDIEFDSTNAIVVCGNTRASYDFGFGPPPVPNLSVDDAFVAKWNAAGVVQWANVYVGTQTMVGPEIAIDSTDSVYFVGKSFGGATYGSTTAASGNQFCVKVNSAGVYQWDWWFLSGGATWGVDVDSADNVLIGGGYTGPVNFGGGPRTAPGSFGSFLCKRASDGTYLWDAVFATGSGVNYSFGLGVVPADGSARIAGNFDGTEDFQPGPGVFNVTAAAGTYHAFVSRINADGLW